MTPSTSPLDFLLSRPQESTFTPTRLPSLYADLSQQRTTNPDGFSYNSTAWLSALSLLAVSRRLPTESLFVLRTNDALLSCLSSRQYGRPTGLGVVLDQGLLSGKVMRVEGFRGAEGSIYEKGWLKGLRVPTVGEVVRWSLRSIGVLGRDGFDKDGALREGEVVLMAALEDVSARIMRWWEARPDKTLTGRIFSREEFAREVASELGMENGQLLSKNDLDLLLLHLHRDRRVLSYNYTTIKFCPQTTTTPEPITAEDTSIANLHLLIINLTTQISQLETHIANLHAKATLAVKTANKRSALSSLRSKSLATKHLDQKESTLRQLEEVYHQITQAADQIGIINTLKDSAGVLKSLNRQIGDVEKVDDIMDSLREEMGKTSEVGDVLRESLGEDSAVVEGEVDEEFERMEREERERREGREAAETARRLQEVNGPGEVPVGVEKADGVRVNGNTDVAKGKEKGFHMDVDAGLSSSIERLKKIKLDSASPAPDLGLQQGHEQQQQQQKKRQEEMAT